MLTMKKGAVSPFYLQLACETLRNFASFDKVFTFTFTFQSVGCGWKYCNIQCMNIVLNSPLIILLVFKLKENLQALPQSLDQLVVYSLERLCSQYRHLSGLRWALAALAVSASGENFNAKIECKNRDN